MLDSRRLRGIRCGVSIGPSQNKPSRPNIDSHTSSRQSSDDYRSKQFAVSPVTAS